MVSLHEDLGELRRRVARLRILAMALMVGFTGIVGWMQIVRGSYWRQLADLNHLKRTPIKAERGHIRDRDGRVLVVNRAAYEAVLVKDLAANPEAALARAAKVLGLDAKTAAKNRLKLKSPFETVIPLKADVPLAQVAAIEARNLEAPEIQVRDTLVRSYPNGALAAHVLGHVGEIRIDQLQLPAYKGYAQGDVVGQSGIESHYESYLRGRDGTRTVVVDSHGREVREMDRPVQAQPGYELITTLDLDVIKAGEDAFAGKWGAAVVMDVKTGAVLAMFSLPAYDPNAFASGITAEDWRAYSLDESHPLFDRALKGRTAPGSVFKIVDFVAGLEEGVANPDAITSCGGATVLHGDLFHCWKPHGHGGVALEQALEQSCDVYFYHLGERLGIDRLSRWAKLMGLNQATGIDLDQEAVGLIPDPKWKRAVKGEPWWPGETPSVAIGQGAVTVTVLEVASMLALVGNGGVAMKPYLVEEVRARGQTTRSHTPEVLRTVKIAPQNLKRVQKALWDVVNRNGTAARARLPGYDVSGKTGTAQVVALDAKSGPKDNAWFAAYAPGWDPQFAVAVLVDHGGHGGEVAAPIARALLETALKKKGIQPRLPVAVAKGSSPVGAMTMVDSRPAGVP